jgi:hypothetical protein
MLKERLMRILVYLFAMALGTAVGWAIKPSQAPESSMVIERQEIPLMQQVKEDDDVCPIIADGDYDQARVTFLPVPIEMDLEHTKTEARHEVFDPVLEGKDLYTITGDPWYIQEIDVDWDRVLEKVYYGNVAMNHTPHTAVIVKDGKAIFRAGGANVWIETEALNSIDVTVTLDWVTGKYKRTRYNIINGHFVPVWYQISCEIMN